MPGIITIVLAIVIILTLITFYLLKKMVRKVDDQSKVYFMMKIQSYDDLIEQKEVELKRIKEEVKEEKEAVEAKQKEKVNVIVKDDMPKYKFEGLLQVIKKIDSEFNYDTAKIVEQFVESSSYYNDVNYYLKLLIIKSRINNYGLFNFIIRTEEEQIEIIKRLNIVDENLMNIYSYSYKTFDINNFLKILEIEIKKSDPIIYVYVGDEKENYNRLGNNVKTCIDKTILKGVKIKFHNVIYEYCLSY